MAQNNEAVVQALGQVQKSLGELTTMLKDKEAGAAPKASDEEANKAKADAAVDDPVLKAVNGINDTLTAMKGELAKALALPAGKPGSEETVEPNAAVKKASAPGPFGLRARPEAKS